jgi:hypothetical protein
LLLILRFGRSRPACGDCDTAKGDWTKSHREIGDDEQLGRQGRVSASGVLSSGCPGKDGWRTQPLGNRRHERAPRFGIKQGTTFDFVVTNPQLFTTTNLTAKVSFSCVVLGGGKPADVRRDVSVSEAAK